jgi:hypothetical protein
MVVLIVNHIFACLWIKIHYLQINSKGEGTLTWLNSLDVPSTVWKSKYVHSFYYTIVTMISVGYGDISPKTDVERVFCVFSMLICCAVFGKY